MTFLPTVLEQSSKGDRVYDLYSRMLKDRIIFVNDEINDHTANLIIAQLLFLESEDPEQLIYMYINSPGGVVSSGLGIISCMQFLKNPISTIITGQAASMGSLIASSGTKGYRKMLKYSTHLVHQPLGGAKGQASDLQIQVNEILRLKELLTNIYVENTGQTFDTMTTMMDRDTILDAKQCIDIGLVDEILIKRP
jgi:ATP-dependent Clp protease protease subunit